MIARRVEQAPIAELGAAIAAYLAKVATAAAQEAARDVLEAFHNERSAELSVSLKRAAELLDVDQVTVARRVRSGEIRSFKMGGRRLVSLEALREFIAQREQEEA